MPALVGFRIYRDITRNVVKNNYGLGNKGLTTESSNGDTLIAWLHSLIQSCGEARMPSIV
jgi:hypothetical protein